MANKNCNRLVFAMVMLTATVFGEIRADDIADSVISVTQQLPNGKTQQLSGRIHVEAQDGGLMLESATGRIDILRPAEILNRQITEKKFEYLSNDLMAKHLLESLGNNFAIHQTDHFLICSDASEVYTQYCGQLLELVLKQYERFFEDSEVKIAIPTFRMQVIVFRNVATFQQHAKRQHPETDFSDVPGYYSIRDNQMLVTAVSGDRDFRRQSDLLRVLKTNLRQVETIVHESIHQLAFNTGLHKRYADVPTWLSEGLAIYFESTSGRSSLAWNRPGETSRLYLPLLKTQPILKQLPLPELIGSNQPFQQPDLVAAAYSESWALVHFFAVRRRNQLDALLLAYQQVAPRSTISADKHLQWFTEATNQPIMDVSKQLKQHVLRLRVPR